MTQRQNSWWQRHKFKLNALVLLLPLWFFYQSMHLSFPPSLPQQQIGPFTVTPTPLTNDGPYQHHQDWVKDFSLQFCQGCVGQIRQAYMVMAEQPPSLSDMATEELGILHGDSHWQHVHALIHSQSPQARLWLVIEDWQGQQHVGSWPFQMAP